MKDTSALRQDAPVRELRGPRSELFWADLPARDHAVQIYANESSFMDALEGFVASGLRRRESVIVIATAGHLHDLEKRLRGSWLDIDRARWEERYIAVLAQETLNRFMVDGEPDEELFKRVASELLARARGNNRKVRAFGEMVAILWAQGNAAGAIKLEQLWSKLQALEEFPLFCAYPHAGFAEDATSASIERVCSTHTRVIPGYK